jgi:cytosine/adenosine deaminase-related metal-dependent hydrolase
VRAVSPAAISEILADLPADVPLHVHVSEQPQENADSLAAYGLTPTAVLAAAGALSPRTSLIHATHLTDDDQALIAASGATVVMCPTTEADLGDGIGPARSLSDAGVPIALGSDQNAVIDPFLEMRGLEAAERLASGRRGRFSPTELSTAASAAGYASLGMRVPNLTVGAPCDLVEVSMGSLRTTGSLPTQLAMAATASDVRRVIVGGRVVATDGALADGRRPEHLLRDALARLDDGGAR